MIYQKQYSDCLLLLSVEMTPPPLPNPLCIMSFLIKIILSNVTSEPYCPCFLYLGEKGLVWLDYIKLQICESYLTETRAYTCTNLPYYV